jgi:hypothetical protein
MTQLGFFHKKTHLNDVDDDEKWQMIDVKMGTLAKKEKRKNDDEIVGPLRRKIENIGSAILDMIIIIIFFG